MGMTQNRAAGALMGAFIGDALGLGCHWYYDLDELHKDYGPWISGYTTPKAGRYHAGMQAGQLSQSGIILKMLVQSLLKNNDYNELDFTRRLDEELFPQLDGTPMQGPGGYTSQSIRHAYTERVKNKTPWNKIIGHADTTEAAERALAIAIMYANHPDQVAAFVTANCKLTQNDEAIVAMTTAYNCILSQLVAGEKLDESLSDKLMQLVQTGKLPFHAITNDNLSAPSREDPHRPEAGLFASPDALLTTGSITKIIHDADVKIEPAWKVSLVYGMPCAIYHQLPAAYYLAARYANDFESAVLHAINGGGQNMSRAMLTGALVGAQIGLDKIPQRFIDGLADSNELVKLAKELEKNVKS
jgi:ADP-ribosylglycohydrolase